MFQGKRKNIEYNANQYIVNLKNSQGKLMDIIFQLSHDGVALRYHFPETSKEIKKITEEKVSFLCQPHYPLLAAFVAYRAFQN